MTMLFRQADCGSDCQEIVDTLQANLPYLPHARLFQWLYRRNPEGPALVWVARDPGSGRMIGVAAAFPRRLYCSGKEVQGYLLGDFCISASHRSLGLAVMLQRACLEGLTATGAKYVFDFPSHTMLAVYRRLHIAANQTMIRHAKLLHADRKVAERLPAGALARGLSVIANAGLRLRDAGARRRANCAITAEAGPWGEEFTQAGREWSPRMGTCVARTAEYLNWRYGQHPLRPYEMLTARDAGTLGGYLVQHMEGVDCSIDDLVAGDDNVRCDLLLGAIAAARERRVQTLSAPWLSSHPGSRLLQKCGFRPRESRPLVVLALPQAESQAGQGNEGWYLSHGDWET
jgi:hypothetical protein